MINKATICSFIGASGVIVTSLLSVQCYKKFKEEDDVKTKVKKSIPAIISGGVSIGCIFAADRLNKKEIAVLTASAAYFAQKFSDYEKEVRAIVGDEKADEIENSFYSKQIDKQIDNTPLKDDNMIFVDSYSGASISARYDDVVKALKECEELYKSNEYLCWCDIFFLITGSYDAYDSFLGEYVGWSKNMFDQWYGEDKHDDLKIYLKDLGNNRYLIKYNFMPELGFNEY